MPEPKHAAAKNWSRQRRFDEAVRKVVYEHWTQAKAAEWYGVSRPRLNEKIRDYRAKLETAADAVGGTGALAEQVVDAARGPLGLQERRRIPPFEEFDRMYFGRWVCPDCHVHHATPEFHREIAEVCQNDDTRVLINVPPYHSKSTNVTVKDTVYDICRDPNLRTIIISKSLPFARTFLQSIDQLLTNPELYAGGPNLIEDWGPFRPQGESIWNRDAIYVAGRTTAEKDGTVQVLGVGGQVYGRRADKIKLDDCATLENQKNPARVAEMVEWVDKEVASRIGRSGKLIWVGTRVHPGDVYSLIGGRPGYRVLRYPAIIGEGADGAQMLWGDHFTYDMALQRRTEMSDAAFQLIYQNVDVPGLGASFTAEMLDGCKDTSRVVGQYDPSWRLIAGLDLAGGTKDSGYTAGVLWGVDLRTGKRFLVDIFNVKSMRSPALKQQILDWSDQYPIYAWRVEANGLQSQIVQYDIELVRELATRGIRLEAHSTQKNKWDPQFGVESMAPLYSAEMVSLPWGNAPSARVSQQLVDQLVVFPMGMVSDVVMAHWFADLGCRDLMRRAHLPMFNERMKVPERVRRRRITVDFGSQEVRRIPLSEQRGGSHVGAGAAGYRRLMVGRAKPQAEAHEPTPEPDLTPFTNVPGNVEDGAA
jgi:hypothetical protein